MKAGAKAAPLAARRSADAAAMQFQEASAIGE
jgi:hypothetical protein